jgi:hypothetical protein
LDRSARYIVTTVAVRKHQNIQTHWESDRVGRRSPAPSTCTIFAKGEISQSTRTSVMLNSAVKEDENGADAQKAKKKLT